MSPALEQWNDFNVAMAGATAALAGLAIVAASVNIRDIIKAESLTARLAAGVAGLAMALVGCAVGLMPGIAIAGYGVVMIVVALIAGAFQVEATRRIFQNRHPDNRMRAVKAGVGFAPIAAYLVGGALLAAGLPAGLILFGAGAILAIASALVVSWVVLVEVLR